MIRRSKRRSTWTAALAAAWCIGLVPAAHADRHVFVGVREESTDGNVVLSPDGKHLYLPQDFGGPGSEVTVFSRDAATGVLKLAGATGSDNPKVVAVSPDGAHVYAVTGGPSAVEIYARNLVTGLLTLVEVDPVTGGNSVAFSPDGAHLYIGSSGLDRVVVLARNATTGELTFVETQTDGVGGVDALLDVQAVLVSPDGAYVYASGGGDNAIAIFSRNGMTGALTYLGKAQDPALVFPGELSMTSDGAYLYAGGKNVTAFSRNPGTGALTFIDAELSPPGIDAGALKVSPDGSYVYAGISFDQLRVFARDPGTGTLTFAENFVRDENGVGRIGRPVVVSPDGRDVYTGGRVAQFRRVPLSCSATAAAGCFGPTEPGRGMLKLADNADDTKDALTWTWTRGQAVTYADFGNPIDPVTDYALCVYDASGGGTLLAELLAPAGPGCGKGTAGAASCWKAAPSMAPTKVSYRRKTPRHPDGVSPVRLAAGVAGKPSAKVKARGAGVPMPALPLTPPVTVQLQNGNAKCWENVFSTPALNDTQQFKGTAD